jgi:hypothetical protein
MLDAKVIRPSTATEYSQVLLVPKKPSGWRFCIDYRRLNDVSKIEAWPLPNVKHMLNRLGTNRSEYYGTMDLTKGYYQACVAERCRKYTAFITFFGIFEWLRVPMGVKGAPSYFQAALATVVLAGLLHIICELYIDDIIVHGATKVQSYPKKDCQ